MTEEEILNIPEGKKMDALIAKKVMGVCPHVWHVNTAHEYETSICFTCLECNTKHWGIRPPQCEPYSSDIEAAWQVIEQMESENISFSMGDVIPNSDPIVYEFKFMRGGSYYYACEFTVPLAICRAALLTAYFHEYKTNIFKG